MGSQSVVGEIMGHSSWVLIGIVLVPKSYLDSCACSHGMRSSHGMAALV